MAQADAEKRRAYLMALEALRRAAEELERRERERRAASAQEA